MLFALPSLILLILLNLFPVIYSFLQSLQQGTPSTLPWETPFVGFQNYLDVLTSDQFVQSAIFTLIFTVVGVFGSWIIGLLLALLLRTRIPGGGVFKVLLSAALDRAGGGVRDVLELPGRDAAEPRPDDPLGARPRRRELPRRPVLAQVVVCIFKVWISFPFMMMMMSSALASVDTNVYEAAKMDGATSWQAFRGVTLPIISRTTYISWVLMTIFCVNDFPTIFLLTQGGPVNATTSLIVLAYQYAFQNLQTGPATAVAFMMTAVLVIISTVLYRQIQKADVE